MHVHPFHRNGEGITRGPGDHQLAEPSGEQPTAAAKVAKEKTSSECIRPLQADLFERAREEAPGWDIHDLERQWRDSWAGKTPPRYPEKDFLAWLRKVTKSKRPG